MSAAGDPLAALFDGELAGCCADVYELPAVRWLLDGELHPGGRALSLRAARLAGIGAGSRVADVASGGGATALLLAEQLGAEVVGVELGSEAVARASAAAARRGLGGATRFVAGHAAALPLPDGGMDAVLCECSLCLFDDKPAAVREMARVLRPGGTVVICDVTVVPGGLPPALQTAAARVACVADALALEDIERLLRAAGLEVQACEPQPDALAAMARRVEARLRAARMLRIPALAPFREQLDAAVALACEAERAIDAGVVGYALIAARRPG